MRSLGAVCAAPRVDDVRVHRADVFDVELVLLALRRHVVGEEDVSGLGCRLGFLWKPPMLMKPRWVSPRTGCSTFMTSAPQSARIAPAAGTNVNWATSRTRTPCITLVNTTPYRNYVGLVSFHLIGTDGTSRLPDQPAMNWSYAEASSGGRTCTLHWRCLSPSGARMPRSS